ncbi:MAG: zinc-dependent alcohol dehydrogenase [Cetobacterium sp.]
MKQAIMIEPGKIEFREVEIPEVKQNQIMVKMKAIGVCGSDCHVNVGEHPYTSYPVVQGHEVSAEVVQIGKNVKNVEIGDRVTIQPQVVCGTCYACTHDMYNVCEELKVMGFQTTGMASEYFVVDSKKAIKLPENISWEYGALLEPLAVAVHAVKKFENIENKKALILGGGPIGNLVAQVCKAMGANNVLLSEMSDYRLDVAKECGINTVDIKNQDLKEVIDVTFGPDKADVIFECVGINQTMKQAIEYARKGSSIVVVGVFGNLASINMGLIQDRELTLIGSAMYKEEDFIEAIRLLNKNLINLDKMVTDYVKFEDYKKAYDIISEKKDKVMKVIIQMD